MAKRDATIFTPIQISQGENGFVVLSCSFAMFGPQIEYVVVHGMNRYAEHNRFVGEADSALVEIFIGGDWRPVPDQRWCGTGIGVFHFVPEADQTLYFGVMKHSDLRQFLSGFGDPDAGILLRAVFSVDVIRPERQVEPITVRSAVCFARIGPDGLYGGMPTDYTAATKADAQDIIERLRREPNPFGIK